MLSIKRTCTNKIITRALALDGEPLVALLRQDAEDCEPCADLEQLQQWLDGSQEAFIVYNQHAQAKAMVENLKTLPTQVFIEIRQDTKGVLGLHALRYQADSRETLELIYR